MEQNKEYSRVETITPQIAREYLALNIVNRPAREVKINEYAAQMLKGQWILNGEAICFNCEGYLVNGQHRLRAVIKASETRPDISFRTFVVRGVSKDSFITFDSGINRRISDIFFMSDIKNAHSISSLVFRVLKWRTTKTHTLDNKARAAYCISKQDVISEYESAPDYYQRVYNLVSVWYERLRLLTKTDIGVLYIYLNKDCRHTEDVVSNFFEMLFSAKGCDINAIALLRQRLLQDKVSKAKLPPAYKFALIVKSWNAYITGKDLKTLRWNESVERKIDFI